MPMDRCMVPPVGRGSHSRCLRLFCDRCERGGLLTFKAYRVTPKLTGVAVILLLLFDNAEFSRSFDVYLCDLLKIGMMELFTDGFKQVLPADTGYPHILFLFCAIGI